MKKIPLRQCLGCKEMKPKAELIRIVRAPDNTISLDSRGKAPGRGAYICKNAECLKKALKSNAAAHALNTEIPKEVTDLLLSQMESL